MAQQYFKTAYPITVGGMTSSGPVTGTTITGSGDIQGTAFTDGTNQLSWGAAAPVAGTYAQGDVVFNTGATAGGTAGWVCVTAGTPGTWKAFGTIAA